jgi:chromosome condensin MukBEF MukE localization factor
VGWPNTGSADCVKLQKLVNKRSMLCSNEHEKVISVNCIVLARLRRLNNTLNHDPN